MEIGEIGANDLSALSNVTLNHWIRATEPASRVLRRLLRVAAPGTVLQMNNNGGLDAIVPTWKSVLQIEDEDLAEK